MKAFVVWNHVILLPSTGSECSIDRQCIKLYCRITVAYTCIKIKSKGSEVEVKINIVNTVFSLLATPGALQFQKGGLQFMEE